MRSTSRYGEARRRRAAPRWGRDDTRDPRLLRALTAVVARLAIAIVILGGVGALAWRMRARRPDAPPRDAFPVPRQLDRDDFVRPDAPFLVALFSSTTCE